MNTKYFTASKSINAVIPLKKPNFTYILSSGKVMPWVDEGDTAILSVHRKKFLIKMDSFSYACAYLFIFSLVFLFLLHIAASSLSKGILLIGCLISISPHHSVSHFSAEWVDSPVHHRMLYPQSTAFICLSHPCSLSLLLSLSLFAFTQLCLSHRSDYVHFCLY